MLNYKYNRWFCLLALLLCAGMSGCVEFYPTSSPGGGGGGGGGGFRWCSGYSLVNCDNEGWADTYSEGSRDGFILHSNGTYTAITERRGNGWSFNGSGSWSICENNRITLTGSGFYTFDSEYYSLSWRGDQLTIRWTSFDLITDLPDRFF